MKFSSFVQERDGWETISSELHYENAHLAVATEEVRTPERPHGRRWTTVRRKAAVVVAPMTFDGRMVLIRQERIPIRASIWEVPAGQIDDSGELEQASIEAVALQELREETGYGLGRAGGLVSLGHFFSSAGFTDEHAYFFLARNVEPLADGHAHHGSEVITDCAAFTPRQLRNMIADNEIRDANTLGICAKLVARGFLSLHA